MSKEIRIGIFGVSRGSSFFESILANNGNIVAICEKHERRARISSDKPIESGKDGNVVLSFLSRRQYSSEKINLVQSIYCTIFCRLFQGLFMNYCYFQQKSGAPRKLQGAPLKYLFHERSLYQRARSLAFRALHYIRRIFSQKVSLFSKVF